MSRKTIRFTVAALNQLTTPTKSIAVYKDSGNPVLCVYVTPKGVKTFFVRKRILGRDERIVLGRYPIMSIEQARNKAIIICGTIANGKDPKSEQRKQDRQHQTFGAHFEEYLERYSKPHKKTWGDDKRDIHKYLSRWFNRRLSDITKEEIQRLHEQIGANNGRYQANRILQRIRAIYNKAIEWGWHGINPAQGIKKFKEKSRERFILPHEMPYFIKALQDERNQNIADYFRLLLLTGTRKTNLLNMQWHEINFHAQQWQIQITKNGDPLTVPLMEEAILILERRYKKSNSKFVFPSERDKTRRMTPPRKAWLDILARATLLAWHENDKIGDWVGDVLSRCDAGDDCKRLAHVIIFAEQQNIILPTAMTDLRIHDIRRTFGSYQAITGASLSVIGKSLGHKCSQATQVYARLHLDPIRESMEKATRAMFVAN
jgi:integrase